MTLSEDLAAFAAEARHSHLPASARERVKVLLLDSLGCAIRALEDDVARKVCDQVAEAAPDGPCTALGGGRTAPHLAACQTTALTRYLDFMDGFAAKEEACHPSDNVGAVLAAAEAAGASGRDLLTALAVAFEAECRLVERSPITQEGFDHTTQLAISIACGAGHAMRLDRGRLADAIGCVGASHNSLRVVRTGHLSNWKGLAASDTAMGALWTTQLCVRGVTGPREYFEGDKGYLKSLADEEPDFRSWSLRSDLRLPRIFLKKHNVEIHAQSAVEALLELRKGHGLSGRDVESIEVKTFREAYTIIGGGEGDAYGADGKDQADHSFPYVLAVAALDGEVWPEQYAPQRVRAPDVQRLLRKVKVRKSLAYTRRYPEEFPNEVTLHLRDGRRLKAERADWDGFHTRPWDFGRAKEKFDRLAEPVVGRARARAIADTVRALDQREVADLTELLGRPARARGRRPAPKPVPRRGGSRRSRKARAVHA
jgi:2-methylcitrate dehydratase